MGAKAEIEKQITAELEKAKAEIQKKEDNYKADKDAKNTAAFKVMDVNGDGTIQLSEFVAMFEPESAKNTEFQQAIGFLSEEEAKAQKAAMEAQAQCNQQ